jgi:hypothetical protein
MIKTDFVHLYKFDTANSFVNSKPLAFAPEPACVNFLNWHHRLLWKNEWMDIGSIDESNKV